MKSSSSHHSVSSTTQVKINVVQDKKQISQTKGNEIKVKDKEQGNPELKKMGQEKKEKNEKGKDISSKSGHLCTIYRNMNAQHVNQKMNLMCVKIALKHAIMVRLVYTFVDRTDMYMVMEYCENGDLRKVITELQQVPEEERLNRVCELFAQIILSLNFIHSMGVIHRDIKPENIFIMEDGSVRLGDFGLSKVLNEKDYATVAGTKYYFAPEVFQKKKMFFQTDIYSCGIVFCELLIGYHPLLTENEKATIENMTKGSTFELPIWVPTEIKELIMRMMNIDYNKRPTTQELMKIQIIKQNIELFDIQQKKNEEYLKKKQYILDISAVKPEPVSYQQTKDLSNYIEYLRKSELTDKENFNKLPEEQKINILQKLSDCLLAVRSVQTMKEQKISGEMKSIAKKISNEAFESIYLIINKQEHVDFCFQNRIVVEMMDCIRRTPIDKVLKENIQALSGISENGSVEHNHKLFEMDAFKILIPVLKNQDLNIQQYILYILIDIIRKGWKYEKLSSIQLKTQSLSSFSSTNPSYSSFSALTPNLQQLLLVNEHPYTLLLEKQGVIKCIIEDILMNKNILYETQSYGYDFLDVLYYEGAKLPSNIQQQLISDLCQQAQAFYKFEIKEDDEEEDQENTDIYFALDSLSRLSMNKGNNMVLGKSRCGLLYGTKV
ncbi:MAG: putative protein kinase,serine/threonine-protein kinase [Streblomastix strix]|uniref:non-specific serine/threonine protein kinase n=1 Tax=Streblomastix strix TaxID=222440 RepID=A0A5J4X1P9_9EUKA|nr:MAG: putative protein kinase,serine/threonine-protein kinase [Streblomastix strix]